MADAPAMKRGMDRAGGLAMSTAIPDVICGSAQGDTNLMAQGDLVAGHSSTLPHSAPNPMVTGCPDVIIGDQPACRCASGGFIGDAASCGHKAEQVVSGEILIGT